MTEASARRTVDLVLLAALVLAPAAAALVGSRSGRPLVLNLGPGDGPYIRGFADSYEIDDKVATQWTGYEAEVRLPLALRGGGLLSYRFARILPETAQVEVRFSGGSVDRFACRGGIWQERQVPVGSAGPLLFAVSLAVDSHDRQRLGLKMDWLRLQPSRGTRVFLRGAARWRAALLAALVIGLLRLAGWSVRGSALVAAPLVVALVGGLLADPWLTHRLLTGVPEFLGLLGAPGAALGRWLHGRGRLGAESLRLVTALAFAAFLVRAAAVNHPAFYYPDLRTHALLVEKVQQGGLDFLRAPAKYIWEHGVWRTEAYGRTYAFPYSPAFHLPFVPLRLPYDSLLTAMKLWAAALSVVPLILVWALARRLGASALGALLMLFVPTYTSRLSFAFLPALFGHAVDMAFVYWLAGRLEGLGSRRGFLAGAAFVAACQLAYVSGVVNVGVLVACLAVAAAWDPPAGRSRGRAAALLLAMGLVGSALSLALYYRDFLGMVADVVPRIGSGARGGALSRYPVQGFLEVAYTRTRDFFDGVYPVLAAAGFGLLLKRGRRRGLLVAWLAAYLVLLLGRAKVPDIFLHGHETLFVTPLVCLAAGEALAALGWKGLAGRIASFGLLLFLAAQGAILQWRAIADQLRNAL